MTAPTFQPLTEAAAQRIRAVFKDYIVKPVWVGWKPKRLPSGKYTKPPYQPNNPSEKAEPDNPATWGTFDTALAVHQRGEFAGVGICILGTDLVGFDLDNCIRNGNVIEPFAIDLINEANTYVEVSPSGTGLHIFGVGSGPPINRKQAVPGTNGMSIETCRASAKYFTVTGNIVGKVEKALNGSAKPDELVERLDSQREEEEGRGGTKWSGRSKGKIDLLDVIKNGRYELFKGDRSRAVWFVVNAMIRAGAKDDAIVSTLLNPDNRIGDHCRDQPQGAEKYARRQAEQARAEIVAKRKSERERVLDELNAENAVVMEGGKTWVLRFAEVHHIAGDVHYVFLEPVYLSFQDFRNFYLNRHINVGDEEKPKWVDIGSWWLEHPNRRQYSGVTFQPGEAKVIDGQLNLWRGFGVKPKQGDWSLLKEHIKVVLCASNEVLYDYVIKWIAWAVQHPGERAEVAIVFKGDRGTGKGTLGNALCVIFGQHQLHASTAEELTGRFNDHLRQSSFLFADEAYGPKDKAAEGELKRLITEPTIRVEAKRRVRVTVPNRLHVMMASNNDWVIPAGAKERRFVVGQVSNVHQQEKAWFDPLYKQLREGGYEAMLYYLLRVELGDWHPRQIVRTAALAEQQEESLTPREEWWFELLQTGVLPGARQSDPSQPISNRYPETKTEVGNYIAGRRRTIWHEGLYDAARASTPRLRGTSDAALGRFLAAKEQGCKRARPYRRRGWQFPPLADCRKRWLARFPDTVWHDPDLAEWQFEPEVGSFEVGGAAPDKE